MIWLSLALLIAVVVVVVGIGRWALRRIDEQNSVWGPRSPRRHDDPGFLSQLAGYIRGNGPK